MPLTDEEVIATSMEPKPERKRGRSRDSIGGWWRWVGFGNGARWEVPVLGCFTLDRLHLVEDRLTDSQWRNYEDRLESSSPSEWRRAKSWLHATAAQKIRALAAVLRPEVERG